MYITLVKVKDAYLIRHILRDLNKQHQFVMSLFDTIDSDDPRKHHNILWRIEEARGKTGFIVQSDVAPDLNNIKNEDMRKNLVVKTTDVSDRIEDLLQRDSVSYKIVANPVKKSRDGKRRIPITNLEEIYAWWDRKLEETGLKTLGDDVILDVENVRTGTRSSKNGRKDDIVAHTVTFVGRAQIEDAEKLRHALHAGIGREKSYGYGMLTLASAHINN